MLQLFAPIPLLIRWLAGLETTGTIPGEPEGQGDGGDKGPEMDPNG